MIREKDSVSEEKTRTKERVTAGFFSGPPGDLRGKRKGRCVRFKSATRHDIDEVTSLLERKTEAKKTAKTSFCGLPTGVRDRSDRPRGRFLFRTDKTGSGLVAATMSANGFKKTNKEDFCVYWASHAIRAHEYKKLKPWQRCNQFPRTSEITKKSSLCRAIVKMQQLHGKKKFKFLPLTFILPEEKDQFQDALGENFSWIVKPANSSCGRGIFVTSNPRDCLEADMEGNPYVVSQYIDRPLLIDSLKFDMRIYVAVSSFDPLTIYVYDDGLARFATEKYTKGDVTGDSKFQHLTNYSVNKYSANFVANKDASVDCGTKQSLQVVMRKLRCMGLDVSTMWARIHDVIIKTLISIEGHVKTSMRSSLSRSQHCCFQLFGFDVLVDEDLSAWLVEVNFSPSLNTDADIDLKIKGKMLADLFNLAGVKERRDTPGPGACKRKKKNDATQKADASTLRSSSSSATGSSISTNSSRRGAATKPRDLTSASSTTERTIIGRIARSDSRSGGFYRIFPHCNAFLYRTLFENAKRTRGVCGTMASRVVAAKSLESSNDIAANYFFQETAMKRDASSLPSTPDTASMRVLQKRMLQGLVSKGLDRDGGCLGLVFNDLWGQSKEPIISERPAVDGSP